MVYRYILGKWTIAEGAIFSNYKTTSVKPVNPDHVFIAGDYGTTNPTAYVALHVKDGIGVIADEFYWDKEKERKEKSEEEFAVDMQEFINRQPKPPSNLWIDPAAATFRVTLARRGIYSVPADNEVLDGIRNVSSAFSLGELSIYKECKNTLEEIQQYRWDPKFTLLGIDKPLKVNDHAMDAMRYVVRGWRNCIDISSFRHKLF